jgi:hypothetical protein
MQTSTARRSTSQKLRGAQIPLCFAEASIATAALGKGSKSDKRRSASKAQRLVGDAPRFLFRVGGSVIEGAVQGNGGIVTRLGLLLASQRLVRAGREHGLYAPKPGHVAVFPDYCATSNGESVSVDLSVAEIEVSL